MQENVRIKIVYDVISLTDETKYNDQPLLHKLQEFEPVLEDTKAVSCGFVHYSFPRTV